MGRILRLTGVNLTDAQAPRIKVRDKLESVGSLLLFDGSHPFAQFSGLPAAGQTIPNALSNFSADLLGVAETETAFSISTASADLAGVFKKERTSKGGIHGIVTQAGGQAASQAYVLAAAIPVRNYIRDNVGHTFYISLWQKITRKAKTTSSPQSPFHFTASTAPTSNYRWHMQGSLPAPASGPVSAGSSAVPSGNDVSVSSGTDRFTAMAVTGNTGTVAPNVDPINLGVGTFGAWNSLNYNVAASRVIYRAYIEDLTVSGRTYAEVEAIDRALWQEAFGVGGKFYGDTYTDPATTP